MKHAPRRLRDDPEASPALRADMASALALPPPPYDVSRGLVKFEAALSAGPPPSPSGGGGGGVPHAVPRDISGAASRWMPTRGGWWWTVVGGAGVAAGVALLAGQTPRRAATPVPTRDVAPPTVAPPVVTPALEPRAALPEPALGRRESLPEPARGSLGAQAASRRAVRPLRVREPGSGVSPTPGQITGPRAVDPVRREIMQLARARAELPADPTKALALADEGHLEFPDGVLREEREAIAIFALMRLGRTDEGKQRAHTFLARYPRGPFSERVRRWAGTSAAAAGDR